MRTFTFVALLAISANVFATTCSTVSGGDWGNDAIWSCGVSPDAGACYDTIIINHPVTVNNQVDLTDCGPIFVFVNDVLTMGPGKKLGLAEGTTFDVNVGGEVSGGSTGSQIVIGTLEVYNGSFDPIIGPATLFVNWLDFHAVTENDLVILNWSTAQEVNNEFFSIERSQDGQQFETIGEVDGAGTSVLFNQYTYTDKQPLAGLSYYRIKQTDYNGVTSTSDVVAARTLNSSVSIALSPNPAHDQLRIAFTGEGTDHCVIEIIAADGRMISQQNTSFSEASTINLSVSDLSEGIYLVRMVSNGEVLDTEKLVID